METPEWDFKHACLGIIGEIGELADAIKRWRIYENPLNQENVLEELGDLRFYMQMLVNTHNFKFANKTRNYGDIEECVFTLTYFAGMICGNNIGNSTQHVAFLGLHEAFLAICRIVGFTEENVIQHNVAKLIKRYAENVLYRIGIRWLG